jgi:hypothetical protein
MRRGLAECGRPRALTDDYEHVHVHDYDYDSLCMIPGCASSLRLTLFGAANPTQVEDRMTRHSFSFPS